MRAWVKDHMEWVIVGAVIGLMGIIVVGAIRDTIACHKRGGEVIQVGTIVSTHIEYDSKGNIIGMWPVETPIMGCSVQEDPAESPVSP